MRLFFSSSSSHATREKERLERSALRKRAERLRDITCRLLADSLFQEGGPLSDYAGHLKIQFHPTNQHLVQFWNGREWKTGPLFTDWIFHELIKEAIRRAVRHRFRMKSSPVKARPGCLPCDPAERVCHGEVRSSNHDSHGESGGLAHAGTAIDILEEGEMCVPPARPHWSHGLPGNISGEGTSTMQNPVSPGRTPGGRFDSLAYEHAISILPESVSECETLGPQFPQANGGNSPNHLKLTPIIGGDGSGLKSSEVKAISHGSLEYDVPTMWNISGEGTSTMHNHISRGTSPSSEFDGIAQADIAIDIPEEGGSCVHSLDGIRPAHCFSRLAILGDPSRLAILGDPLFDVNFQGAFALVAFKTSDATSPAKDALLYLAVFLYVFGFLSALGDKVFHSSKMQMSGSAATVLGFLLTMVLILV